jgi:hypothetical protein
VSVEALPGRHLSIQPRTSSQLHLNSTRDFSVYVLDPLESLSDLNTTSSTQSHVRGVAVGLSLVSWALLADKDKEVKVTGTLITMANGEEALEVILALREVHVSFYSYFNPY